MLAEQVPSVPNAVLILVIACGVGLFLVVALLRMLIGISLSRLLIFFYLIVFLLAFFVPDNFLAVAFDAGGVTTGPMTVPFIMSLGVGIAAIRSDKHAADDSFGLVALCSIGPVLSVLLLALIFSPEGTYLIHKGKNHSLFPAGHPCMRSYAIGCVFSTRYFFGDIPYRSLKIR